MHLLQDFRYGFRILIKSPAFAVVAVLTLAIGIGANTAIFSVVDAVLLRPLVMAEPDRVMLVTEVWRGIGGGDVSIGNFVDIRQQNDVFQQVSAMASASFNLALEDAPERVSGSQVSTDFFETFGVAPLRGRIFRADENEAGRQHEAILSEPLWRTRFHADEQLLGKSLRINGLGYTVVGIMPATFDPVLDDSRLWIPAAFTPRQLADHDNHYLVMFGRLKPGVSLAQANASLGVIGSREQKLFPIDDKERTFNAAPLTDALLGDHRLTLFTLLAAVALVLLIACANIANLQLARGRARRQEIAVRAALGATPRRIVQQLLAENMLLSLVGGGIGVLLAVWGVGWLVTNAPASVPRMDQARMDGAALLFACVAALVSSFVFGMAPALRSAAIRLVEAIHEGSSRTGSGRDWLRNALVVGEVGLAIVLLTGAGLLIRSSLLVAKVDPGFDTSNLTVGRVGLPDASYHDPGVARKTFENIIRSTEALPGVERAVVVSRAPLTTTGGSNGLLAEGKALDPANLVNAALRVVSPGYLGAMHVPLKAGRDFTSQDTRERPLVVLVNQTLANAMWPGENPISKRFACCEAGPQGRMDPVWHEVVGVVADVRAWGLEQQARPEFYMPLAQMPPDAWDWIGRTMDLVVRTRATLPVDELRHVVASAAPGVPIYAVSSMQQKISSRLETSHFDTFLVTIFAATALLLAILGVYGVLSYMVAQRTREIGIRMALGATRRTVIRTVLGQGMRLAGAGLAVGIGAAFFTSQLLSKLLYGVRPTDLLTYLAVSVLLAAVALVACWLPARRASRVDPMVALRYE